MIELIRSEDAVFVSWLMMRLAECGIKAHLLDAHTSSVYGGAVSAVRQRVMVEERDLPAARRVLAEASGMGRAPVPDV